MIPRTRIRGRFKALEMLGLCFGSFVAIPASVPADRPGPGFELVEGWGISAPDDSWRIEQYVHKHENDDSGHMWEWEIWLFPVGCDEGSLLTRRDDHRFYGSYFDFSPDGRWLVRSQKIVSGTHTVYLYERDEQVGFRRVTERALGDLAWSFFRMQPEVSFEKVPAFHQTVQHLEWRDGRYLILALSADIVIDRATGLNWILDKWLCGFDLQNRGLKLLPGMAEVNRERFRQEDMFAP